MPNSKTMIAQKQIDAFKQKFFALNGSGQHDNGHYVLAMQAAVPVFFSPDLLYRLWQNFRTFQFLGQEEKIIHEVAVSDLLLSPLCKESGFDMYEMPAEVRDILLKDLQQTLGADRVKSIATFLEAYSEVNYREPGMENFRSVQQWAALSLTNPNAAVKQVSEALSGAVANNNVGEQLRLAVLLEKLAPNANEFSELLPLGEGIRAHSLGNTEHVVKMPVLRTTPSESGTTLLTMLLPETLRGKVERQIETQTTVSPLEERLQKCRESGGKVLDLSNLDLEELPKETFEFSGLENLILSKNPLKQLPKEIAMFGNLRDLIADNCELDTLPDTIEKLRNLEFLDLANNHLATALEIKIDGDVINFTPQYFSALSNLPKLKQLHLENNLLEVIPKDIVEMRSLEKLSLERNLMKQPPFYIAEQGLEAVRLYFEKGMEAFEQKAAFLSFFPDDTASELVELIPLAINYGIKLWFQEEEEQTTESEDTSQFRGKNYSFTVWENPMERGESPSEEEVSESMSDEESASEETEESLQISNVELRDKANAVVVFLSDAYLNFDQTLQQYISCWQQGYRVQHIFLIATKEMRKGADLLEEKVRELYDRLAETENGFRQEKEMMKAPLSLEPTEWEKSQLAYFQQEIEIIEGLLLRLQKSDYYTLADLQQQRYEPLLRFIADAPSPEPLAEAPQLEKDREAQIAEAVKTTRGALFLKDTNYEPLQESLHLTYQNSYQSYLEALPETTTPVAERLYHGFFNIEGKIARILLGEPLRLLAELIFLNHVRITLPYEGLIREVVLTREEANQYTGVELNRVKPETDTWENKINESFIHNEVEQRKWMEDKVRYFTENGHSELVLVRGGTFRMGSEDIENARPVHDVTLDDFYIGKYTVTNEEYCQFLNAVQPDEKQLEEWIDLKGEFEGEKCRIRLESGQFIFEQGYENYPVIFVSWFGAKAYCDWVNGDLPTEAQWEYAAKGGHKRGIRPNYLYAGSINLEEVGWYKDNADRLNRAGEKAPNELGLCDMSGNVQEWSQDWFDENFASKKISKIKTKVAKGRNKTVRGGSWTSDAKECRIAERYYWYPGIRNSNVGFRICKNPLFK